MIECKEECFKEDACVGIEYDTDKKWCYLKSDMVLSETARPEVISWHKECETKANSVLYYNSILEPKKDADVTQDDCEEQGCRWYSESYFPFCIASKFDEVGADCQDYKYDWNRGQCCNWILEDE